MERLATNKESYSPEWFKNRALVGLHKLDEGRWDYSDSLLLYLPGHDETYEAVQETDTPYHKLVTVPERAYLEAVAPNVVATLPEKFEYDDLGPGTEHKEQFLFDAAKAQGKRFIYRPVDISDRYLGLSAGYAAEQGIEVAPLRSSFEEVASKLGPVTDPRFVSLGLTYSNYAPAEILSLLKHIAGEGGTAFINAQLRERTDMEALRQVYEGVAATMAGAKIELLGLDAERDIAHVEVTDEVKVWYTLKKVTPQLEAKGIRAGDKLLVFQSLRPTREKLEQDVAAVFPDYELLDTGGPFVAAVLKA